MYAWSVAAAGGNAGSLRARVSRPPARGPTRACFAGDASAARSSRAAARFLNGHSPAAKNRLRCRCQRPTTTWPPPPPRRTSSKTPTSMALLQANTASAFTLSLLAGLSTGIGGWLVVLTDKWTYRRLGYWQGAAGGFMLSVTVLDLMPQVLGEGLAWWKSGGLFAAGVGVVLAVKTFFPEPDLSALGMLSTDAGRSEGLDADTVRRVLWSGLLTAGTIGIHNFPEGIAVFISTLQGVNLGLPLAIAIGLHNIPEGMAVALPIFFATRRKRQAALIALVSGLAEPLGVLLVILFTREALGSSVVALMLSAVAGIMSSLSVVELIPQAVKHAGWRGSSLTVAGGFVAMATVLLGIESAGLDV